MQNTTAGSPRVGSRLPLGDVVQLHYSVLLRLEVRVGRSLPGLYGLKGHLLVTKQNPEALMRDVIDHPLRHQKRRQLRQAPGPKRQTVIARAGQSNLLDIPTLQQA